jgi:GT2 family glycosyltransferase
MNSRSLTAEGPPGETGSAGGRGETPRVTIVVVPRERFSQTERSLEDLYEHTTLPFHLIYVDAGSPPPTRRYLELAAKRRGFQLIQADRYLGQNAARNLTRRHVKTEFVVFLDNDILLTPGWLEGIVRCADETGAWVVGPLYLEGELDREIVHMAGGTAHITEEAGESVFYDEHAFAGSRLPDVRASLTRRRCDYVEFHCTLVRNDVLDRLGPLDEEIRSIHEHIDLGMRVRRAGGSIYFEPSSVVSYVPPPPYEWRDFPFFMVRWSDAWNESTLRRFKEKWGYSHVRFFGDSTNLAGEETILRWARGHRRLMTGLRISGDGDDRPETPGEEAQLMVALLLSVERDRFDLLLTDGDERVVEEARSLTTHDVLDRVSDFLLRSDDEDLNLMIRPLTPPASHPVALVRLDDVDEERLARLRRFSFLVLETGEGAYQCWLAVARGDPRSGALWRRLGLSAGVHGVDAEPVRIAGSRIAGPGVQARDGDSRRVRLVDACAGLLNPLSTLESEGLLPLLRQGILV